jgi:hypothetical protein
MPEIVLVTGGSGLVGQAIKYVIETEPEGSKFGKKAGEKWIFAGSSDGDLRYGDRLFILVRRVAEGMNRPSQGCSLHEGTVR